MRVNIQVHEMRRAIKYVLAGISGLAIGSHVRLCSDGQVTLKRYGQDEEKTTVDKVSIELEIMRPKNVGTTFGPAQLEAQRQVHAEAIAMMQKSLARLAPVGMVALRFNIDGTVHFVRDDGAIQPHGGEEFAMMAAALAISMPEPQK